MFITFEGIDGCGKSTQAEMLVRELSARFNRGGAPVLWTKEPGGWDGGFHIRELLLTGELFHPLSELFLFLADRCEHVCKVIKPFIAAGGIVVCERYTDSTFAYQAWGRGIPVDKINELFKWADFPVPDLTLWLDLPVDIAIERVINRGSIDRFEAEGKAFLERVNLGFISLAEREPYRIKKINALEEANEMSCKILSLLEVYKSF